MVMNDAERPVVSDGVREKGLSVGSHLRMMQQYEEVRGDLEAMCEPLRPADEEGDDAAASASVAAISKPSSSLLCSTMMGNLTSMMTSNTKLELSSLPEFISSHDQPPPPTCTVSTLTSNVYYAIRLVKPKKETISLIMNSTGKGSLWSAGAADPNEDYVVHLVMLVIDNLRRKSQYYITSTESGAVSGQIRKCLFLLNNAVYLKTMLGGGGGELNRQDEDEDEIDSDTEEVQSTEISDSWLKEVSSRSIATKKSKSTIFLSFVLKRPSLNCLLQ